MVTDADGQRHRARRPDHDEAEALDRRATAKLWDGYKAKLDPVLRFSGSPYAAAAARPAPAAPRKTPPAQPSQPRAAEPARSSPAGGTERTESVRRGVARAAVARHAASWRRWSRTTAARKPATLRGIQVGGMVAALLLLGAIFFYFARNLRKEEAVSTRAAQGNGGHSAHGERRPVPARQGAEAR